MATRADTVVHLLVTLADAGALTARKMFGEYALYLDGKVVGLICDDRLFLKPTPGARAALPDAVEDFPYPGAKPHLAADGLLDDPGRVARALRAIAADLPTPTPKPKRLSKRGG
jgi:TfoX/Sxy family transcriptional regulator of competence genes